MLREGVCISQVLSCKNRPLLGDSALQRFNERTRGLLGAGLAQTIPQVRGDRKTAPATKFWTQVLWAEFPLLLCRRHHHNHGDLGCVCGRGGAASLYLCPGITNS